MNPLASRPLRAVATALTALLLAAGLFLGASPASAAHHAITISGYSYHPAALVINAGDTVTWTNLDSVAHDVTLTRGPVLFHSPLLSQGQSFSYTFTVAGPYTYVCSVHPGMTATLTVQPAPVRQPVAAAPTTQASKAAGAARSHHPTTTTRAPNAVPNGQAVQTQAQPLATSTSTQINPLLLVAGALCAVVIFCLLVMASRPQPVEAPPAGVPSDGDESTRILPPPPPELVGAGGAASEDEH